MATTTATATDRKEYEAWLAERMREEDLMRIAAARKKNGRWRNFWTDYGPDLLFAVCVLGGCVALVVIYLTAESLGWFNL